jgi:TonB family protein
MFDLKTFATKTNRRLPGPPSRNPQEPKQRRMMVAALTLLLVTLGSVLYRDRDFWFPDTREAEDQPQPRQTASDANAPTTGSVLAKTVSPAHKRSHTTMPEPRAPLPADAAQADATPADSSSSPATATIARTVLPPLEVEVVAGDTHRTVHPGTNAVSVDLQPTSPPQEVSEAAAGEATGTAASVTSTAAERVNISANTAENVSQTVKPGYPLLARQMKVQGSVILQALIGRDGLIQDLRVLSGPPILASAAQEAVKQWHFKPHLQGAEPVETQARITVNFTISTN